MRALTCLFCWACVVAPSHGEGRVDCADMVNHRFKGYADVNRENVPADCHSMIASKVRDAIVKGRESIRGPFLLRCKVSGAVIEVVPLKKVYRFLVLSDRLPELDLEVASEDTLGELGYDVSGLRSAIKALTRIPYSDPVVGIYATRFKSAYRNENR